MTNRWLTLAVAMIVGGMIGAYAVDTYFSNAAAPNSVAPAMARWPEQAQEKRQLVSDPEQLVAMFDSLYAVLYEEVEERRRLQEALSAVQEDLDTIRKVAPALFAVAEKQESSSVPESKQTGSQARLKRFLDAGFAESQAADLQRLQDEFTMQELYLRDQASREGWINSSRYGEELGKLQQNRTSMREDLGDDDYDRFLYATGQQNRVVVRGVLEDSPAKQAGLAAGDAILSYDGQKVFSLRDLMTLQAQGSAGEQVAVDVLRAGQPVQIWIPRGPMGFRSSANSVNPDSQN